MYDGTIPMAQSSDTERPYYFNWYRYENNPDLYNDLLTFFDNADEPFWYVWKQYSAYQQTLDMQTWEDVKAGPNNLKESLYYSSGLAFMLDS